MTTPPWPCRRPTPASQTCSNVTPGTNTVTEDDPRPGFDHRRRATTPTRRPTSPPAGRPSGWRPASGHLHVHQHQARRHHRSSRRPTPSDPQDFTYVDIIGSGCVTGPLDDDATRPRGRPPRQPDLQQRPPGTKTITEDDPAGWASTDRRLHATTPTDHRSRHRVATTRRSWPASDHLHVHQHQATPSSRSSR